MNSDSSANYPLYQPVITVFQLSVFSVLSVVHFPYSKIFNR